MSTNTRSINNINQNNNNSSSSSFPSSSDPYNNRIDNTSNCNDDNNNNNNIAANSTGKRKRRPAGTPDPDAEVVSLSPRTLLESDRYVCEICNQGFQRDQNLQMHRRRHKVPWKLLKRSDHHDPADATGGGAAVMRKRVFVCPEPTCLHHDRRHALGDLVGIKKHFRRKHSNHKQWACGKCSKAYAVHSDFKAHLKTCGTRGHSCDCGRVFSRVESFIEHQDTCHMGRLLRPPGHHITPQPTPHQQPPSTVCLSRTPSSPSSDTNHNPAAAALPWVGAIVRNRTQHNNATTFSAHHLHNLDLQLSIGSSDVSDKNESSVDEGKGAGVVEEGGCSEGAAKAQEMLKLAMAEMAYAEEARREAKRQIEIAESEFASAKKIRQQALAELEKAQALKAQALKEQAVKKINSTLMQITCHACKHKIQLSTDASAENGDRNP